MRKLNIRASMLPNYIDCSRMAAARQWPQLIVEAGYPLRSVLRTVGAAIGTADHVGMKVTFLGATLDEAIQAAYESFDKSIQAGIQYDDTTSERSAHETVSRMVRRLYPVFRNMDVLLVEHKLKMDLGDGFEGTGSLDWLRTSRVLGDLKGGRNQPHPQLQLAFYAWLARSNGIDVEGLESIWLPRPGPNTAIKDPIYRTYDLAECEAAARDVTERIQSDVTRFLATGDKNAFTARPTTLNCGSKFCPAWGTTFCTMGKPE